MNIMSTIPWTAARVISAVALAIFFAPFALLCGKHSASRVMFKTVIKSFKTESKLFAYGIYGALIPSKGIDRIHDALVNRVSSVI